MKSFIARADYPVVDTVYGKLKGFFFDGLFQFRGIQYAKAKRFQPAEPVDSWEGVKDATNYGFTAPTYGDPVPRGELMVAHRYWPENETCQYLNIWTPVLDQEAKKPVLVWFHGGGFSDGSSLEQLAYDGDALSKYGDVVVITLNHRLNILGYLDMSSLDEKYANSVNAGVTDLVEALKWVRDNIAGFGGDPDNVTIFGQSGGGGKVATLLQTPAADGLYHKAFIMSGTDNFYREKDAPHGPIVREMLKVLNLADDQYEKLETIPYRVLMKAYIRACNHLQVGINWGPVANDYYLGHPCDSGVAPYAKKVPTVVGTVINEFFASRPGHTEMTPEAEKLAAINDMYNGHGEEVIEAYRKAYPGKDLCYLERLDTWVRPGAVAYIKKRADSAPEVPGWIYQFALVFDINGGTGAWHCADIPFVFHNTELVPAANIEGVSDKLEKEMTGALLALAKNGDPNHPDMPEWKPYTSDDHETMIFDRVSFCMKDPDTELISLIKTYGPKSGILVASVPKDTEEEEGRDWMY